MSLRTRMLQFAARSLGGTVINLQDATGWDDIFAPKTAAGVTVTHQSALNLSAIFACVRLSTETLSTIPVHIFKKTKNGREEVASHPVTKLLTRQSNPEMPANVFREVIQGHLELRGKAFAEIVRDGYGDPVELWPIHPDHIRIKRGKKGGLLYEYLPTGHVFPASKILHFRGLGSNGIDSYSVIQLARESIGLGLSAQQYGSRFFGQGTNMGGFLRHPKGLSDQAFTRLREEMNQKYKGLEKSHGLIILEEGLEYQKIGLTNEDAQFLETRKFQNSEIARWFGMKPHMIGDLEKATFSNIEQQSIEAVAYTWRPRVIRLEQEITMKLLREDEYMKYSLEGLLRGDIKSRYEAYKIAIENGWMNADEIRALEDMNPQPDGMGQIFLAPLNMGDKRKLLPTEQQSTTSNITAITAIVEKVNTGGLPKDAGLSQLKILFGLTDTQALDVMGSAGGEASLPDAKRVSVSSVERRTLEVRSLADRRFIADRYRGEVRNTAQQMVRKEIAYISEHLVGRTAKEMIRWLKDEYPSFSDTVQDLFTPLFRSLGEDLYPVYAAEVSLDADIPDSYRDLITKYVSAFALRYTSSSKGQLVKLIEEFEEEYQEQVNQRMASWEETNAQKIEQREVTRIRNYLAKGAYGIAGITKIRSVAHGDSCPFCSALDGKVIGIEESFIYKGEEFKPEGAHSALVPHTNRTHAPYHDGCDCDIVAEGT